MEPAKSRFRSISRPAAPKSPEDLWYALSTKRKHEYLRGPQQDVLREYVETAEEEPNVALELPTGTGKTTVGLLIAEWRRLVSRRPVTYLTLTNQLARQVVVEAGKLGIEVADITGTNATRSRIDEGMYKSASAIGVTTYANLFNAGPVVTSSDVLVFDDVHGGEQYVIGPWEVRIERCNEALYATVLNALVPALTNAQLRSFTSASSKVVHLANMWNFPECIPELRPILEESHDDKVRFSWPNIRDHLAACAVLVSRQVIVIRPLIAPTHDHQPFAETRQRLYLSATLGGAHDLQRAYGIESLVTIAAPHAQSGRRFIFVPGAYVDDDNSTTIVSDIWNGLAIKRSLLLAPSELSASATFDAVASKCEVMPNRMTAKDIVESLELFTTSVNNILTVPGRYDGIDLPQEDCRLLIFTGAPVGISELERHLTDNWKLGPVLRGRERTRFIQGLGRCTRGDTDYSIVFLMRQSLIDAVMSPHFQEGLPKDVRAELVWGITQSEGAAERQEFVALVSDLLKHNELRAEASELIRNEAESLPEPASVGLEVLRAIVRDEIGFSKALWDSYWEGAVLAGQRVTDQLSASVFTGYRAWWGYLTAIAAKLGGQHELCRDSLQRAIACGVNQGFLSLTIRSLREGEDAGEVDSDIVDYEAVWQVLDEVGWSGPNFDKMLADMHGNLAEDAATPFHMGTETLGKLLGAETIRSTEQGAPDVVWAFASGPVLTFEAKTEKTVASQLSKKDILEANGHIDWASERLQVAPPSVVPIVVSSTSRVHDAGEAHVKELRVVHPNDMRSLGQTVASALADVRSLFRGREFSEASTEFAAELGARGVRPSAIREGLTSVNLSPE